MSRRKNKSWKLNLKFLFLFVAVIFLLSLIFKTGQVIKNSIFDGTTRITLVLGSKKEKADLLVFSLEPKAKTIKTLIIPANLDVQVAKNFGTYLIGNVYPLGNLSPTSGGGGELLRETVQEFIGAPVDGWMIANSKLDGGEVKVLVESSFWEGVKGGETNLTLLDFIRIWYEVRQIKIDKIEAIDLKQLNIFKKTYLLDKTEVYQADPATIDQVLGTLFHNPQVLAERKTVEIINGTGKTGFGNKLARIINNMGAQVLFVRTSDEPIKSSSIKTRDKASYTVEKIRKTFKIMKIENEKEINADISILIGEDF